MQANASAANQQCWGCTQPPPTHASRASKEGRRAFDGLHYVLLSTDDHPACHAAERTPSATAPRRDCTDLGLAHAASSGARLLLGVISGPSNRARRDAIRHTWLAGGTSDALVCFVLGIGGQDAAVVAAIEREAHAGGDLHVGRWHERKGRNLVPKVFGWFLAAARALQWVSARRAAPSVEWVGKTDDDGLILLPHLVAELASHRCLGDHLFFGDVRERTSFDPRLPLSCRIAWGVRADAPIQVRRRLGCQPAFPFAQGMLYALSAPLVQRLIAARPGDYLAAQRTRNTGDAEDQAVGAPPLS